MCRRNQTRRYAFPAQAGMTMIELIIACSILLVLATAAMPVARFTVMRQKESELRRSLREIRDAIDRYKDAADRNLIRVEAGTEGYPPDLETLVAGVEIVAPGASPLTPSTEGAAGEDAIRHVRFLRRIPEDPMTRSAAWGQRAVQDDPDSNSWGGQNVFDVYSLSNGTALDGTRFSDW